MKYNDNGEYKDIYIKTFDTLPVGTEVEYDGNTVPDGWTEVEDVLFENASGTAGTSGGTNIPLSNAVTNYDELEVQVGQSLTSNATYIIQIDGTNGIQDMYFYNLQYNFGFKITASGSALTFTENFVTGWDAGSSKIFKVIGRNKKIKKTSQYIEDGASISNVYGTSQSNGYSQEYINSINTYSTDEVRCGTWIDGKPIYRKVIDFGALPNATTKSIAHNISNIDKITKIEGITYANYNYSLLPLVYNSNEAQYNTEIYVGSTYIYMKSTQNRSGVTAYVTLEYTKTTD